jgi:flagellar basal-body rod modification protein FlgD
MDIAATLNAQERLLTDVQVGAFNKALGEAGSSDTLDRNDFLKILITQLTHQDPTEPMKDREFIAQMAQFSTLEQITNMSQDFGKLAGILSKSQALGLLGKTVEILSGSEAVVGVVEEVSGREFPQVLVGGRYYDFDQVERVKE